MKIKIIQPEGVRYLIQETHYSKELAEIYINMLIEKMERYVYLKKKGERIAPLMTITKMEEQLKNMREFTIEVIP